MTAEGKVKSIKEAADTIHDGSTVGLGGFSISRKPVALTHEIIRQRKRNLTLVGTNISFEGDLLIGAGCVKRVEMGTVNLERFGLARMFRRAAESGLIEVEDHSHFGMMARLIAGELGLPFMPTKSWRGSDIMKMHPSTSAKAAYVKNPFKPGKEILVVPALNPDVSIIHVQKADEEGNAIIEGLKFHDVELARASRRVIISCEEIVSRRLTRSYRSNVDIPALYVDAVVEVRHGAHPTSVFGYYDYDSDHLRMYQDIAREGGEKYELYLNEHIYQRNGWDDYLKKVGGTEKLDRLERSMELAMRGDEK